MKLHDIVIQLHNILPIYTNRLSPVIDVLEVSVTSDTITVTCSEPHKMKTGDPVTIVNSLTHTAIDSVVTDGLTHTFTTATNHDLTLNYHTSVELNGFSDSDWNGSFELISVPNRVTFKVRSINSEPVLNGLEYLLERRIDGINGIFPINYVDIDTFTCSGTFLASDYDIGNIYGKARISSAITIDRAIENYTEQKINDLWAFVTPENMIVSKERNNFSDALSLKNNSSDLRLTVVDGFSITLIANTSNQLSASNALDICKHDMFLPLMRTVYGAKFESGLSGNTTYKVIPTKSFISEYNRAIMAYTYSFEVPYQITGCDAVENFDTSAFKSIDYTIEVGDNDVENLTVIPINLDEEVAE